MYMTYLKKILFLALMCSFTTIFISCDDDEVVVVEPTLYEKLGGTKLVADPANLGTMIESGRLGLRSVVDSTIFVIVGEGKILQYFTPLLTEVGAGNTTGLARLSKNLTDFFCVGTGAKNFAYGGLNMKDAHDPAKNNRMALKVNNADMDIFIQSVVKGAQQNNVPADLIGEVGKILESLRADVVQR
jgi:hypothetical protein